MSVTVAIKKRAKLLGQFAVIADVTFDSSYPTNGEPLAPALLGLSHLDFVLPSPAAGYIFEFDHAANKLKAFTPVKAQAAHTHAFTGDAMSKTPTTVTPEPTTALLANVAGVLKSTDVTPIPLGTPTGSNASGGAITAAAASEVANAVNLSTLTVRVLAIGY
jgi:hypothetical protein